VASQTYEDTSVITYSLSHALWELQSNAVHFPATVKPWFTGTLLVDGGTENAYLRTFAAHTGGELAGHLHAADSELVHLLACIPWRDGWDIRSIVELKIGKVGDSPMLVIRDSEGDECCPDSPLLPPSSVSHLVQLASVVTPRRPKRDEPLLSLGLIVHYQVAQKALAAAEAPAPAAQATI
jgi:hypothetical protein